MRRHRPWNDTTKEILIKWQYSSRTRATNWLNCSKSGPERDKVACLTWAFRNVVRCSEKISSLLARQGSPRKNQQSVRQLTDSTFSFNSFLFVSSRGGLSSWRRLVKPTRFTEAEEAAERTVHPSKLPPYSRTLRRFQAKLEWREWFGEEIYDRWKNNLWICYRQVIQRLFMNPHATLCLKVKLTDCVVYIL